MSYVSLWAMDSDTTEEHLEWEKKINTKTADIEH
jgi:hypothetical protein